MFRIFQLGNWIGVGGSEDFEFAPEGIESVRFCERHGLPPQPQAIFTVLADEVEDRRAAESWPEALNSFADLPHVKLRTREACEFRDMLAAGVLAIAGPEKFNHGNLGVRVKLTCSPFELVQWRRAWAAEQRAKEAEAKLAELETARSEGDLNDV